MWCSMTASPTRSVSRATRSVRSSSTGSGAGASGSSAATVDPSSLDDNGITSPARCHVLVADALLQQHDTLEQGLRPWRAARDVHVDGNDLVDALGHRVGVPVRAAAVRARTHGDDVLRVGHLLV